MTRCFYAILFAVTVAIAVVLWLRHDPLARSWTVPGARQAQAQTYPTTTAQSQGVSRPAADERPTAQPAHPIPYPVTNAAARQAEPRQADSRGLYPAVVSDSAAGESAPWAQNPADGGAVAFEGAKVLATVGTEVVLAGEVMCKVNAALALAAARIPRDQLESIPPAQWEQYRNVFTQQYLRELVETRMLVHEARRNIPEEHYPKVIEKLEEGFEQDELKNMLRRWGVATRSELDARLRRFGSSVEREKRFFVERTLARQWVQQQVKVDTEITHQQMLDYYYDHLADYEYPAQARWEHLMVRFSNYATRREAERAIAEMGNQVLDGAPLADVAKARSDGPTAAQGGQYDWTTQGSLVSEEIDRALFTLPPGAPSEIISDERGLHIVRVLERRDAGRMPFAEAQVEIRERIGRERVEQQAKTYLVRLQEQVPVRTVFDAEGGLAAQSPAEQRTSQARSAAPR